MNTKSHLDMDVTGEPIGEGSWGVGNSSGEAFLAYRSLSHSQVFFSRRSVLGRTELLRADFASQIKCSNEVTGRNDVLFFGVQCPRVWQSLGAFIPGPGG